jgi:hypothetical protein
VFYRAVREHPNLSITEFSTWPALYQFTARHTSPVHGRRELLVKPDGFIRIRERTTEGHFEHLFFLELDRSTESQEIVAQKAACYLDYYHSGGLALRFGNRRDNFKSFPFRVLMVFKTGKRQNNALERLIRNIPPILTQVWASTLVEAANSPLTAIWTRPKDYLSVAKNHGSDSASAVPCGIDPICASPADAVLKRALFDKSTA